jgi:hypothetical protein
MHVHPRSLPRNIYQQQYLCQIITMAKFDIKSDGYGGIQEITKQLKCEKKSLILWLEFLNTKVLE